MIDKRLDEIAAADLEALVTEQRPETRTLDYKRDLEFAKDDQKKELARDVSAFANAGGGDIVFGVEEDRDEANKPRGIPKAIVGLEGLNYDDAKLRLENIFKDTISPRVPGIAIHKVDGFDRGPVVIIRVPRSWVGPHMVTSSKGAFWSRNSAGKFELDVREIRASFIAGTEVATRIARFRDERIGRIIADETPVTLVGGDDAKVVLHVVPITSDPVAMDLQKLNDTPGALRPPGATGYNWRFNLDGVVAYAGPQSDKQRTYVQAFRNGSFEGVACGYRYSEGAGRPPSLWALAIENDVVNSVGDFFKALLANDFDGPVSVMLALVNVRGTRIGFEGEQLFPPWEREHTIDRDIVVLPDVVVEKIPADPRVFMRATFDSLWQASGFKGSLGYTKEGAWDAKRHRD